MYARTSEAKNASYCVLAGPGVASASLSLARDSCHFFAFIASCAADIDFAMCLLILPLPVQADWATAVELTPTESNPIVATAITSPLRIDTNLLRETSVVETFAAHP